jgi:hypothetical protein
MLRCISQNLRLFSQQEDTKYAEKCKKILIMMQNAGCEICDWD